MQKVVKDNIIYVEKPKMSLVPIALSAASLLFIVLGAASLFYFQKPLQENRDVREQASTANGQVLLTSQLTTTPVYSTGMAPTQIELKYNSQGVQLSGIQIVTKVTASAETPTISLPDNSNLQAIFQEVEQVSGGYLVSVIVTPKTIGGTFSSSTATTFAKLSIPLQGPGQVMLTYDKANSFATVANTNPPRDELRIPQDVSFSIVPNPSPSPNSSENPATIPTPTPSPSPSPSPSPTVSAIPSGDNFWPTSSDVYLSFYTNDSARNGVNLIDLKPGTSYRIRIQYGIQNVLKSSTTNLTPVQTAFVINGQASSYITNSLPYSLISNHLNGGGNTVETTFTANADNTIRITADSNTAYSETNEGDNVLNYTFKAQDGKVINTCNGSCSTSRDCQAGLTCFNSQCRRPDNPDSSSCAAPTVAVVTTTAKSCNVSCTSNKGCVNNLRCYQGACRLATNPSSFTCSAATAGTITNGTGTTLSGEKGEEIPLPSVSPSPSSAVVVSPKPGSSVTPGASLSPYASPLLDSRPENNTSSNLFSNIVTWLQARGISVPVIAVMIGLLLFVLALIFAVLGRLNNRPPTVVTRKEPPKTGFEDELQKKINSLKTPAAATRPVPHAPPVITPQPIVVQPPAVPPTVVTPQPVVPPTVSAAPGNPSSTTMMSRLKDRGVLENMPQAPKVAEPGTPSPQTEQS